MRKTSLLLSVLSIMALCVCITSVLAAEEPYIIPSANIAIDGKPDADLEGKTAKFDMSLICIAGSITEPAYYAYLCYDAGNRKPTGRSSSLHRTLMKSGSQW